MPMEVQTYDQLVKAIRETQQASELRIEQAAEQEKVREAWETGKLIDEHILLHKERADYGKQVMTRLSRDLEINESELYSMVEFAREYPIFQTSGKLSWSHYRDLLAIDDVQERKRIEQEAEKENWSAHELRRQVRKSNHIKPKEVKLAEAQPGKVGSYRVIERDGKKHYDLGFSTYFEIKGKVPKETNPPEAQLYTYPATVTQVVDGDTFHAVIHLGFGITLEQRLRLRQLDAPELVTAEGKQAKTALEKVLNIKSSAVRDESRGISEALTQDPRLKAHDFPKIIIKTQKSPDQHGRYIADVWVNGKDINPKLLETGVFTIRGDE